MIVVCKDCISGNEETNRTLGELSNDDELWCYKCSKILDSKTLTPDEPIYVIEKFELPLEFVEDLEVDSCQNDDSFLNDHQEMEVHEYVRYVLESQKLAQHYPILFELFNEDHESFEIPNISCRSCGYAEVEFWLNYVGISRLPISRFSVELILQQKSVHGLSTLIHKYDDVLFIDYL